jgi:hypothetical protein
LLPLLLILLLLLLMLIAAAADCPNTSSIRYMV